MVLPTRPETNTRSVVQPQPAPLRLLAWHFQPLPSPDPLDTAQSHTPALQPQPRPDPAITVTTVFRCQGDDRPCQDILVWLPLGLLSLCGTMLAQNGACPALGYTKCRLHMVNAGTATSRAQKFPRAAS